MLNEPTAGEPPQSQDSAQPAGEEGEQVPGQARGQAPPGVTYVQITAQEKEAIERVSTYLARFLFKLQNTVQCIFSNIN